MVISILETTTKHGAIKGKTQKSTTQFYNLDAIISVGYRVNSTRATQFRIWATDVLKKYITQGYALNNKLLSAQQTKIANLQQTYLQFQKIKILQVLLIKFIRHLTVKIAIRHWKKKQRCFYI